eukprot:jgi/Orpsp1_1/1192210/evm.model.d7180000091410.1
MQDLITFAEAHSGDSNLRVDVYQYVFDSYIKNIFFPWVCLILLFNMKNWKRPVLLILIGHWFLRSTGDLLRNTLELRTKEPNLNWPGSLKNWYISNALANVFWLSGEIIGDWYPLIRLKAITNNSKKIRFIYVTCIIYNIAKIIGMSSYFYGYPIDLRQKDEDGNPIDDIIKARFRWWSSVTIIQIASFIYDISIIISMKTILFNKIQTYKNIGKNTFIIKFKQISEYRIIISMIASLCFLPFVIIFVICLVIQLKQSNKRNINMETPIEQLRQVVLNFNYTMMYIDQILLRNVIERNQNQKKYGNNGLVFGNKRKSTNSLKIQISHNGNGYPLRGSTISNRESYSNESLTNKMINSPYTQYSTYSTYNNNSPYINSYNPYSPYNTNDFNSVIGEVNINEKEYYIPSNNNYNSNRDDRTTISVSTVSNINPFDNNFYDNTQYNKYLKSQYIEAY